MTYFFADTSALVKRYIVEQGTHWLRTNTASHSGNTVIVSNLVEVELLSALAGRHRNNQYSIDALQQLRKLIAQHMQSQYVVINVNATIIADAIVFLEKHPLRAYDAIQLATAINAEKRVHPSGIPFTMLCSDQRLTAAATVEGLQTDDPNQH